MKVETAIRNYLKPKKPFFKDDDKVRVKGDPILYMLKDWNGARGWIEKDPVEYVDGGVLTGRTINHFEIEHV
jgi:hypothetical protein